MADTKTSALTAATSLLLTDIVPVVTDPGGTPATKKATLAVLSALAVNQVSPSLCGFRLTLTTGVPVTTADVTGATTIYFTPDTSGVIALYDGSKWVVVDSAEVSLALGTLTSGKNYDVFAYSNAGVLTLEFLAWSSDTARATALVRQDGVLCKNGALTRRYVGTFRTTSTTTTEDSLAKRFLWNAYNKVLRVAKIVNAVAGNGSYPITPQTSYTGTYPSIGGAPVRVEAIFTGYVDGNNANSVVTCNLRVDTVAKASQGLFLVTPGNHVLMPPLVASPSLLGLHTIDVTMTNGVGDSNDSCTICVSEMK